MQDVQNKRVTVAGLGHFGGNVAAARWLVEQGATVLVTDQSPAEKLVGGLKQLEGLPINYHLGGHREEDFALTDLVVASPAIPPHSPFLLAAKAAGVPVTTEIRLFVERCPATIVGVTGTKGKSTTTAMLGEILRRRFTAFVGGNIGGSLLDSLPRIDKTHVVVLELSSYMLEHLGAMNWSPHLAVVTLIAPDHLAWHGNSYEAYVAAKANILRFQRPDDFAVVNGENAAALEMAKATAGRVIQYGVGGVRPFELMVPGRHNQLNAQGGYAAAALLGSTWEEAQAALRDFPGLPHRMQLVHTDAATGVRYYNDSIATVPEAAVAALESFQPNRVLQIVGGASKGVPMTALSSALCGRAKSAFCIGATGPEIASALGESTSQTCAPAYRCGDLATAVRMARENASPGDVILLSPGCASHDQFDNFEHRGTEFAKLAREA